MGFLFETGKGQIGFYSCKCGKGGAVFTVSQKEGMPPQDFAITITHTREDGETEEATATLAPWEFANMIMDVTPVFYGSLN